MAQKRRGIRLFHVSLLGLLLVSPAAIALHDPTEPDGFLQKELIKNEKYHLQGIFITSGSWLAMINGQLVRVGSHIQGASVLAIGKNDVVLFFEQHKETLHLFDRQLRKTH